MISKPTPVVAGNWKCNMTAETTQALLSTFRANPVPSGVECIVAPPFIHLPMVYAALKNTSYTVAAQNCIPEGGAYTGEISADMLRDQSIGTVILGHSERRQYYAETDAVVAAKVGGCLKKGMTVIICVGEVLAEREENRTEEVVLRQVTEATRQVGPSQWGNVMIAYEPVWAIGTGKAATPQQAQEVHAIIRKKIAELFGQTVADELRILYGGSVNASNAPVLANLPDVNGFLVGGASLKPDFVKIIKAMAPARPKRSPSNL